MGTSECEYFFWKYNKNEKQHGMQYKWGLEHACNSRGNKKIVNDGHQKCEY